MIDDIDSDKLASIGSIGPRTFITAPPGCGKTYLITERYGYLRYYLHHGDPQGIAAVAYNRTAAAELRARIAARWGRQALDWPNFVGTFDQLHRDLVRHLIGTDVLTWPGSTDGPTTVEDSWHGVPGAGYVKDGDVRYALTIDRRGDVVARLVRGDRNSAAFTDHAKYRAQLEQGTCTHDEIHQVVEAALERATLSIRKAVHKWLSLRFRHILADEVFDLNKLDISVLRAAEGAAVGITLVGDPWQSLYQFRGARPDLIDSWAKPPRFATPTLGGSHRYKTRAMRQLAQQLVQGEAFTVRGPKDDRRPDVALAQHWDTLWEAKDLAVFPCGTKALGRDQPACAVTLLLDYVSRTLFDAPVSGAVEAAQLLGWDGDVGPLRDALEAMRAKATVGDVWAHLNVGLTKSPATWPERGAPYSRLTSLAGLLASTEPFVQGLTVHQAKGLEWDHVDFYGPVEPGVPTQLSRDAFRDRVTYVALTRARRSVRVRTVVLRPEDDDRVPTGLRW